MDNHLSLRNFFSIESYQRKAQNSGLNAWDARLKLSLLIAVSLLNIVAAQTRLSVALWLAGLVLVVHSKVPLRLFAIFFLAPAWATITVMLGFGMGFGSDKLLEIGPMIFYRQGAELALATAVRVACEMTWMAAVFITTPVYSIIEALAWFRIPKILIECLALTYRYIFLLCDEASRMMIAARSRGGMRNLRCTLRTLGMIIALVFLRTYDRSQRIQMAILARGGE